MGSLAFRSAFETSAYDETSPIEKFSRRFFWEMFACMEQSPFKRVAALSDKLVNVYSTL